MEGEDVEDDFANRVSLIYPPLVFAQVLPEDEHLLKPLFMVLNAVDLELTGRNGEPLITFLPIVLDPERKEYTLVGEVDASVVYTMHVLAAIWSTNPVRIRSIRLEPYQEYAGQTWKMRIIVKILSLTSSIMPNTFQLFLRSDKTLLRPSFEQANYESLSVSPSAYQEEADIIDKIKNCCARLTTTKTILPHIPPDLHYKIKDNIETQRNTNGSATVRWLLPRGAAIDVASSSIIWAAVGNAVDNITYGLWLDPNHPTSASARLYVNIYLFSPASRALRLTQTKHYVYYTDPKKQPDPWEFEICGPYQYDQNNNHNNHKKRDGNAPSSVSGRNTSTLTNNASSASVMIESTMMHEGGSGETIEVEHPKVIPVNKPEEFMKTLANNGHASRKRLRPPPPPPPEAPIREAEDGEKKEGDAMEIISSSSSSSSVPTTNTPIEEAEKPHKKRRLEHQPRHEEEKIETPKPHTITPKEREKPRPRKKKTASTTTPASYGSGFLASIPFIGSFFGGSTNGGSTQQHHGEGDESDIYNSPDSSFNNPSFADINDDDDV